MQLAPGQHGLEHISGIHASFRLTCPHNGMQLIYEKYNLAFAVLHVLKHGLQTLLKLASVFRARHQRAHIQCENLLILQSLGHIAAHNSLGKALHNSRLAHAGFTDKDRIVLALSGKDTDNVTDLRIPADYRIKLLVPRLLHQVLAVLLQRIIGSLRIVAGYPLVAPHCGKRLQKPFPGNAVFGPDSLDFLIGMLDHTQEKMLHGNIFVSHLPGFILCGGKHLIQIPSHINLSALHLDTLAHRVLHPVNKVLLLNTHFLNQLKYQAVFYGKEAVEQMFFFYFLVAVFIGQLLAPFHGFHGFLCKF